MKNGPSKTSVKREEEARAISLAEVLAETNLYRAWEAVSRKNGAPGLDHVSVEDYARRTREELTSLHHDVQGHRFHASPLMVFPADKAQGGIRELTVSCLRDRVLARAVAQVLNDRLDSGFMPQCYAYRQRKGALKAVSAAQHACRKFSHVLRADVQDFFDSIEHARLLSLLENVGAEKPLMQLIMDLVRAPRFDGVSSIRPTSGVPQGSPVSPFLSNLYLHPVDHALAVEYPSFIRYADDIVVFCNTADEAGGAMLRLGELLREVRLSLSTAKTRVYTIDEGFLFLGFIFNRKGHAAGREARARLREKLDEGPCADETREEFDRRRAAIVRGWKNYFGPETEPAAPVEEEEAHEPPLRACKKEIEQGPAPAAEGPVAAEAPLEGGHDDGPVDQPGAPCSLQDLRRQLASGEMDVESPRYREWMGELVERYEELGLRGAARACRQALGLPDPKKAAAKDAAVALHGCRAVELWMDLFRGGEGGVRMACVDRLGRMGYRPHSDRLTPKLLEHHWQGRRTLAIPVYQGGNRVRFGVIDIDITRRVLESLTREERAGRNQLLLRDAVALAQRARQAGVESLIESSGYKGYHVWFFLHQPLEAALVRRFLSELVRISGAPPDGAHRELFPPSDERPPEGLQTHMRLPLGVHKLTGERSQWITPEGEAWTVGADAIALPLLNKARELKEAVHRWTEYSARPADRSESPTSAETVVVRLRHGCPVLDALWRKAEKDRNLTHAERMVVRGILQPLGHEGTEAVHEVISNCSNYDRHTTESFLGRQDAKPMACTTIREVLGTFCEEVGCACRFKTCKGDYAHPLRHVKGAAPASHPARSATARPKRVSGHDACELLEVFREYHTARRKLVELSGRLQELSDGPGNPCDLGTLVREAADTELPAWVLRP